MTKKDFQKTLLESKAKFKYLYTTDATVRYNFPYTAIVICWEGHGNRCWVKVLKGKPNSNNVKEALEKYNSWIPDEVKSRL